jgi:hypothetical protein
MEEDMPDKKQQMEAIKLLNDWSKWLITVETGGIVGIISIINFDKFKTSSLPLWLTVVAMLLITTGMSFPFSIYFACMALFSLPDITQRLSDSPENSIFEMQDSEFKVKLADYVRKQYMGFRVGLSVFAIALLVWLIGGLLVPSIYNWIKT